MEREEIIKRVKFLSVHDWRNDEKYPFGPNPEVDGEWKGKNHGVIFELSKHQGRILVWQDQNNYLVLELIKKGKRTKQLHEGELKLRRDFIVALGEPTEEFNRFDPHNAPRILIWGNR